MILIQTYFVIQEAFDSDKEYYLLFLVDEIGHYIKEIGEQVKM